jgi:type I restriction-modification system DNA methylase subunit
VELIGYDVNSGAIHLAQILNRLGGVEMQLRIGDSLRDPLPHAEFIVTDPPLGLRLPTPIGLSDGSTTKDGDCAVVDACLRSLASSGRAVVVTGAGLLSRDGDSARLRRSIGTSFRLVAVIRLPAGVLGGTSIAPAVLVVERRAPTDTLFAVLESDWFEQLQPGGDFYATYLSHMNRTSS